MVWHCLRYSEIIMWNMLLSANGWILVQLARSTSQLHQMVRLRGHQSSELLYLVFVGSESGLLHIRSICCNRFLSKSGIEFDQEDGVRAILPLASTLRVQKIPYQLGNREMLQKIAIAACFIIKYRLKLR